MHKNNDALMRSISCLGNNVMDETFSLSEEAFTTVGDDQIFAQIGIKHAAILLIREAKLAAPPTVLVARFCYAQHGSLSESQRIPGNTLIVWRNSIIMAGTLNRAVMPQKKRTKRDEDEYYCDFAPVAPPVPDGAPGWLRSKDNTWTKVLYDSLDANAQTGHKSLLLYIPPGLTLPPLELPVWQEVIVVSGVLNWLNADDTIQEAVRPYSHVIRPPGLPHGPFSTDESGPGCTMFCKWFYANNTVTANLSAAQATYMGVPSYGPFDSGQYLYYDDESTAAMQAAAAMDPAMQQQLYAAQLQQHGYDPALMQQLQMHGMHATDEQMASAAAAVAAQQGVGVGV